MPEPIKFSIPVEGGAFHVAIVVAPSCDEAARLRATAEPFTITVCSCRLFTLLLTEASKDELRSICEGKFVFSGPGPDEAVQ